MLHGKWESKIYIFSIFLVMILIVTEMGFCTKPLTQLMQCKTVVMKEHPVMLWHSTQDYCDFTELYYWWFI
jgi:hypothetical protein